MSDRSEQAKRTLIHYFRALYEKAGLPWDSDSDAEVGGIVDDIVDTTLNIVRMA